MNKGAEGRQDYLQQEASDLLLLKDRKPTPERLALVTAALSHKFEGIQSVALQVLGSWGDAPSTEKLRDFLQRAFARQYGWSIRGVAIRQLMPNIGAQDADWVLDLYFGLPDALSMHEVFPLVLKLPVETARKRLIQELRNPKWMNRQASVKAIGNMRFADKSALLRPLLNDSDDRVRGSAILLSGPR